MVSRAGLLFPRARAALGLLFVGGCANLSGLSAKEQDAGAPAARDSGHVTSTEDGGKHEASADARRAEAAAPCSLATCMGSCVDGRCVAALHGSTYGGLPMGIATDATKVYWTGALSSGGAVFSAPLEGGAATTLASGLGMPTALLADAQFVYWIDVATGGNDGDLAKLPKGGGTVTTLASSQPSPAAFALSPGAIYLCDIGVTANDAGNSAGQLVRVPLAGGAPTTIATDTTCAGVAVDPSFVYWGDVGTSVLAKQPLGGGQTTTLASVSAPTAMKVSGDFLYWGDNGGGMHRMSLRSGADTLLAQDLSTSASTFVVAVDGSGVYWATGGPVTSSVGHINFLAPGAPQAVEVTRGPGVGGSLALGPSLLYFADTSTPQIDTIPKP